MSTRVPPSARLLALFTLVVVLAAACGGAATAPPAPAGATPSGAPPATASPSQGGAAPPMPSAAGSAAAVHITPGPDLCSLLTPADFASLGVQGAGGPTENNNAPTDFYCVYAGKSGATGGIEFDASVLGAADISSVSMWDTPSVGGAPVDVAAKIPGADKAMLGKANDGSADFALINVLSGNVFLDISIPPTGDWQGNLEHLAALVIDRAGKLAAAGPAMRAALLSEGARA